ncbi:hypothetical protein SAMN04487995_2962 [Dyadobacter koreensis]|uniref:Phosphoribosylpyrophosphate synthetase n=1 Tax=Dyadobacter koreensis TaxID=408657 RepID=A0A1H6VI43_9BACT|nr:hypothetical protein [Dyadobacter koreensis]SEJ00002.1 hypothetical protein SAMN04487995_2962 [Dyadobacter koreensis]
MENNTTANEPDSSPRVTEMATLSHVLEKLRLKKMDNEFRWTEDGFNAGKGKSYDPEDLTIIKTYRFEGESDPADSSILYIIEAKDGLIGYSMDTYGVYSDHQDEEGYDNFIRKIPISDRDEQLIFEV